MNRGELQVAKLTYTIDQLYDKYDALMLELEQLEQTKIKRTADLSRKMFPHILLQQAHTPVNKVGRWIYHVMMKLYSPPIATQQKQKKKGKKKSSTAEIRRKPQKLMLSDIEVLQRLTSKERSMVEC